MEDQNTKARERAKRLVAMLLERTEERGFSEHEAMDSAQKIGDLLLQNDLQLEECVIRETRMETRNIFAGDEACGAVITGLGKLCTLKVYSTSGAGHAAKYSLFGDPTDLEYAMYLYEVVDNSMDAEMERHFGRGKRTKAAVESWRRGFANRVYKRMLALKEERDAAYWAQVRASGCTALVTLKNQIVDAAWEEEGIKLYKRNSPTIRDRSAYSAGHAAGAGVNLSRPLECSGAPAALLG